MKGNGKKKWSGKRISLVALCVVLALVLVAVILAAVALSWMFGKIGKPDNTPMSDEAIQQDIIKNTDPVDPNFTGAELDPEQIFQTKPDQTTPVATRPSKKEKEVINILLIGQDRRPGEGRARSDSMILCSLNIKEKKLVLTSFQRDTYVRFPDGHADHKLNSAYQWGGMPLLDDTLALNYGIRIDGNIEVDFNRFTQLIDLAGGVDIALTEAEANWLIAGGNTVVPGMNHLSGKEALNYARIRKLDNDFGRAGRQRKVILSLLQSCKSSSMSTLMDLLNTALPMVATDMSEKQIISLATELIPILDELEITSQSIPAKGTYESARVKGMYVLVVDMEANRDILYNTIYGE